MVGTVLRASIFAELILGMRLYAQPGIQNHNILRKQREVLMAIFGGSFALWAIMLQV